jgi:hypothetical protein
LADTEQYCCLLYNTVLPISHECLQQSNVLLYPAAFSDFDEEAGPLFVAPASHKLTTVLCTDGRVSHVDVGQVSQSFEMIDAKLRRGDILLMDAFTWHDAWPNKSNRHRLGLYLKFHAQDTPGATGPVLFAPEAQALLSKEHQYKMPFVHSRPVNYRPLTTSIDTVSLVLEDDAERILVLSTAGGIDGKQRRVLRLPRCEAVVDTKAELDAENLIGCITDHVAINYGVDVPWMSWLLDGSETASGGGDSAETGRQVCRYYAHRSAPTASAASALAPLLQSTKLLWVSAVEALAELSPQEAQAVRMWLTSTDADESYVKRGIGKSVSFHLLLYSQR